MLKKLLASSNFITVNKTLIKVFGLEEAVLFSELCNQYDYWRESGKLVDDMFYCSIEKLEQATTLSEYQQRKAIKSLENAGILRTELKGLPATRYFYIDEVKFCNILRTSSEKTSELHLKKLSSSNNQIINKENKESISISKDIDIPQKQENSTAFLGSITINKQKNQTARVWSFIELYESYANLPKVRAISPTRHKAILRILDKHTEEEIKEVLNNFNTSDFLLGRTSDFKANIDWIVNENNFIKILEGRYNNKHTSNIKQQDNAVSETYTSEELKKLNDLDAERKANGIRTEF